jgi:hypothetical protein
MYFVALFDCDVPGVKGTPLSHKDGNVHFYYCLLQFYVLVRSEPFS